MEILKPFEIPLQGICLIEASAGTGKTYNITSLYLRQLLEHDYAVEQILVVTFTKAATEELQARVRGRLEQALGFLHAENRQACFEEDAELAQWLFARTRPERDRQLLRAALASMDRASIFTIHGFCQRVLIENAFDTGMPFSLRFIEDDRHLRQQAIEDFWRLWFGRSEKTALQTAVDAYLLRRFPSPEALAKCALSKLHDDTIRLLPRMETPLALEALHRRFQEGWQRWSAEVTQILRESPSIKRQSYNKNVVQSTLDAAREVADRAHFCLDLPAKFERLHPVLLAEKGTKAGHSPPRHPFFDLCQQYSEARDRIQTDFLLRARYFVAQKMREWKRQEGLLSFDDQLRLLDQALHGRNGAHLAALLRKKYPAAMIDEFQDTDAVQYRIFRRIYQVPDESVSLQLIGDPKQAIYGFRGGDIFTYLQASKDAQKRYSLGINWRASSGLVQAVNALFSMREQAFIQEGIDYQPVRSSPKADEQLLKIQGQAPKPLWIWKLECLQDDPGESGWITVQRAEAVAAEQTAAHIAWLLTRADARLGDRALQAGDIAVLVRTHREAKSIQAALREQGVNSVRRSSESVFASDEAYSLKYLLQAIANCEDEALLRFVLADRLLGYSARELDRLREDEADWEAVQQRFCEYRRLWRRKGLMQSLQTLFRQEQVAHKLLALADGERRLTNLLQLFELCQHAQALHPGMEAMIRWFTQTLQADDNSEERKLRLESDEDLVQVVTMHASKGLEYPVVYIPFPWTLKPDSKISPPIYFHDENGQPCLYLGGDPEQEKRAKQHYEQEAKAECMRLFYVALTRAARWCILGWAKVQGAATSALGRLLCPELEHAELSELKAMSETDFFTCLDSFHAQHSEVIELSAPPTLDATALTENVSSTFVPQPRSFSGHIPNDWRLHSYSSLIAGLETERPDYDEWIDDFPEEETKEDGLPVGRQFGIFIHQLFEMLDFTRATDASYLLSLGETLNRRFGLACDLDVLSRWIVRVLETPLPEAGLTLAQLPNTRRLNEMRFCFRVEQSSLARLKACLEPFPDWKQATNGLEFARFRGFVQGVVDLVFEQNGRYYLVDYKSNRLPDYRLDTLEQAMRMHRYTLQALLYQVALHRHLQLRLPNYDYERHMGGIYYLFLRGMNAETTEGIWFRRPTAKLVQALDACWTGEDI